MNTRLSLTVGKTKSMSAKRIARVAIASSILFVQEELLTFIPNVQLSQFLITFYTFTFGLCDTFLIVSIHVILDNIALGSMSLLYTPAMWIGWLLLPTMLSLVKKVDKLWLTVIVVGIHAFLYSWCFAFVSIVLYHIPAEVYMVNDIVFEIILSINGMVTVGIGLNPLRKIVKKVSKNKVKIK